MSHEPLRLKDDPELALELRTALRAAIDHAPLPFDLDAAVSRFRQQAGSGASSGAGHAARFSRKLGWGLGGMGVVGAVIVAGLALKASHTAPSRAPDPAVAPSWVTMTTTASASGPVATALEPSAQASEGVAATQPTVREIDLDKLGPGGATARAATSSTPTPSVEASGSKDDLYRREIQQLADIRRQLSQSPSEALRLAEQGHREFAKGMLYQEREALAIRALARMGQVAQARTRTQQFVARFPKSPYAEQLQRETGLQP